MDGDGVVVEGVVGGSDSSGPVQEVVSSGLWNEICVELELRLPRRI